jgi:hypothetical protein
MKRRKQKCIDDGKQDRLSDLPDSVVHHILSFINTKEAVQTCILSKRWKNLWKFITTLTLSTRHFETVYPFTKFVSHVLSHRNDSTTLQALDFHREGTVEAYLLKKIVKYAVKHNVQRLRIVVDADIQRFPPCFFSCTTLTSDTLFPNFLNLPALTSLSLFWFVFHSSDDGRVEPFSAFKMLSSLIIRHCIVRDAQNLCISSSTLVNLTICMDSSLNTYFGIELSVPSLHTFAFAGRTILNIYGSKSNLSSIKHVDIDLADVWDLAQTSPVLLSWLVEFASIESLTVSLEALEVHYRHVWFWQENFHFILTLNYNNIVLICLLFILFL